MATKIRWTVYCGLAAALVAAGAWRASPAFLNGPSMSVPMQVWHDPGRDFNVELANNATTKFKGREPWPNATRDPFQSTQLVPPAAVPKPVQSIAVLPERPSAPQFPYRFLGRMISVDGQPLTFLVRDDRSIPVRQGDVLDDIYRIDSVNDTQIQFTYLPFNEQSTLSLNTRADQIP